MIHQSEVMSANSDLDTQNRTRVDHERGWTHPWTQGPGSRMPDGWGTQPWGGG